MLPATHSLHFRVHTRVLATLLLVLSILTVAALGAPAHRQLLTEAAAAHHAGDHAASLAKLEAVRALRPDYPRALLLARGYAAAGRTTLFGSDDLYATRDGLKFAIQDFSGLSDRQRPATNN